MEDMPVLFMRVHFCMGSELPKDLTKYDVFLVDDLESHEHAFKNG